MQDGWGPKRSVSEAVVDAVAAEENVEPENLDPPLYPAVDTDALNSVFRTDDGEVIIRYLDYEVVAHAGGAVEISSLE